MLMKLTLGGGRRRPSQQQQQRRNQSGKGKQVWYMY